MKAPLQPFIALLLTKQQIQRSTSSWSPLRTCALKSPHVTGHPWVRKPHFSCGCLFLNEVVEAARIVIVRFLGALFEAWSLEKLQLGRGLTASWNPYHPASSQALQRECTYSYTSSPPPPLTLLRKTIKKGWSLDFGKAAAWEGLDRKLESISSRLFTGSPDRRYL